MVTVDRSRSRSMSLRVKRPDRTEPANTSGTQVELVCQLPYIIPVTKEMWIGECLSDLRHCKREACRTEILRFILSSRSSHRLPLRRAVSYSTLANNIDPSVILLWHMEMNGQNNPPLMLRMPSKPELEETSPPNLLSRWSSGFSHFSSLTWPIMWFRRYLCVHSQ